jgi:hypothetical protein
VGDGVGGGRVQQRAACAGRGWERRGDQPGGVGRQKRLD